MGVLVSIHIDEVQDAMYHWRDLAERSFAHAPGLPQAREEAMYRSGMLAAAIAQVYATELQARAM